MQHDQLAECLVLTRRSLKQQELVAKHLASSLARLCAETEKLSLMISPGAGEAQTRNVSGADPVKPCLPTAFEGLPEIGDPGTLAESTIDAPQVMAAVGDKLRARALRVSEGATPCPRSQRTTQFLKECEQSESKVRRVFADPEEFRERLRNNLVKKSFKADNYYKDRGWAQYLVRNAVFEACSFALVMFSSIWISIDMDLNDSLVLHEAAPVFQVVAHLLCLLFFLELLIRIYAFKRLKHAFLNVWCLFDMLLVALLVFETWILGTIAAVSGTSISGGGLKLVIVFRVLRLLRVLRVARVLRMLPELMVILRGVAAAVPGIIMVLILLTAIIYVGAITFRGMLEGTALGAKWFPDVLSAMGTLSLDCTLSGARGTPLIREAYKENPFYAGMLLCFVLWANVTMMGVLTGLLVQTVKMVAEAEKEALAMEEQVKTMDLLWRIALKHKHDDSTGTIDEMEFRNMMAVKTTAKLLRRMKADVDGMVNVSGFIFEQHGGALNKKEFMNMILDLRGSQKATVKDHMETRKYLHAELKRMFEEAPINTNVDIDTSVVWILVRCADQLTNSSRL